MDKNNNLYTRIFLSTENATRSEHTSGREKWEFRGPVAEDVRQVLEDRSMQTIEIYIDDTALFTVDAQQYRGYGIYKTTNLVFRNELILTASPVTNELIIVYKKYF